MYSINQDYLRLSDFLRNTGNQEEIYPGLKPFDPLGANELQEPISDTNDLADRFERFTVSDIMIVQYIPVFPVEGEKGVARTSDESKTPITNGCGNEAKAIHYSKPAYPPKSAKSSTQRSKIQNAKNKKFMRKSTISQKEGCGFCRRNGEREIFCVSHSLKDKNGNVTCPILRNYICPKCDATGDHAHTIAYCPSMKGGIAPITSVRSQRKSCGCKWTDQHCHCA